MKKNLVLLGLLLSLLAIVAEAQKSSPKNASDLSVTEQEIRQFYDAYADDLRQHRREAIAERYDRRGYFRMGNGAKQLVPFEESKNRYLTRWTGPKTFAWRDLSIEVLSPTAATVVGLFDWQSSSGDKSTFSYTGVLTKQSGQWRIRVEDESSDSTGYTSKTISGSRNTPGVWKYSLTAEPGASIAAHRHSVEMRITVKSGRKFILMGDLDTARVRKVEAGSTLVIPADTWHVEWWEDETVEEIEVNVPMRTDRAKPSTPRVL